MSLRRKNRLYLVLCLIFLLFIAGCTIRSRTPRVYEEWGRATRIGTAERGGEIGVAALPDGSRVMVAWFYRESPEVDEVMRVQIFDGSAEIVHDNTFELGGLRPDNFQLISDSDGATLLWTIRPETQRHLYTIDISWEAEQIGEAVTIIPDNPRARDGIYWHKTVRLSDAQRLVLWLADDGNLMSTALTGTTQTTSLLQEGVVNADYQLSATGDAHLVWSAATESAQFLTYTIFDPANPRIDTAAAGLQLYAGGDAISPSAISGPTIALEDDHVYVSWNRRIQTPAGSFLNIFYTEFPFGNDPNAVVEAIDPLQVAIPGVYPPPRIPANGDFPYTELGPTNVTGSLFANARPNTGALPLAQQGSEVVFTSSILVSTPTQQSTSIQPALFYLRDGVLRGYQLLTWTDLNSGKPAIANDESNNLYVAWIDGNFRGEKPVYMMATAPEFRDAFDGLTTTDYGVIAFELFNRVVRSIALVFVVIPWVLAPFGWFIVGVLLTGNDMYGRRSHQVFAVGIIVYLLAKYATGQRLLRAIPNAAFMDPSTYSLLVYLIPIIILAISIALVWLFYIRRVGKDLVSIKWFIAVVAVDYVLSIMFYSIGWFE